MVRADPGGIPAEALVVRLLRGVTAAVSASASGQKCERAAASTTKVRQVRVSFIGRPSRSR